MPNVKGTNQYKNKWWPQEQELIEAIRVQQRQPGKSWPQIAQALKDEWTTSHGHQFVISGDYLRRWAREHDVVGPRNRFAALGDETARSLVTECVARDTRRLKSPVSIAAQILAETGHSIPRDFVRKVMHEIDPEGFERRRVSMLPARTAKTQTPAAQGETTPAEQTEQSTSVEANGEDIPVPSSSTGYTSTDLLHLPPLPPARLAEESEAEENAQEHWTSSYSTANLPPLPSPWPPQAGDDVPVEEEIEKKLLSANVPPLEESVEAIPAR